jgi:hypothetical protein
MDHLEGPDSDLWLIDVRSGPDIWNTHAMATGNKRGPKQVTASHKAAMQAGRLESKAVREYLEALEAHKPKRGRKRTVESINKRIAAIDELFEDSDALTRVNLVQERMNLDNELLSMEVSESLDEYEDGFVEAAKAYSDRKGITYAAWREVGVDAAVLKRAGISRAAG